MSFQLNRTSVLATFYALLMVLQSAGIIHLSPQVFVIIQAFLGAGTAVALRSAVGKVHDAVVSNAILQSTQGSRGGQGGQGGPGGVGGFGGASTNK
jgi:hypothetical protein